MQIFLQMVQKLTNYIQSTTKYQEGCKPTLIHSLRLKHEDLGTPGFLQTRFPVPSPPQARASVWALGQRSALHHSYERLSDSSAAAQCTISL